MGYNSVWDWIFLRYYNNNNNTYLHKQWIATFLNTIKDSPMHVNNVLCDGESKSYNTYIVL